MMTKTEARAILAWRRAVLKACDVVEAKLKRDQIDYARCYWLAHTRDTADGEKYGTAPIEEACHVLGDTEGKMLI